LTSAGGALVTGENVAAGGTVPITFSLPARFDDGQYHEVIVGGKTVRVRFTKIGDTP
jgi:hypothetical protein